MNDFLKNHIDVLLKNVIHDWDFTVLITGRGETRVGKSVLGMQICAYWTYQLFKMYNIKVPFNVKENMVLNGSELIGKGTNLGKKYKYAALDFDEAADELESSKVLKISAKAIKDHLRKAAQYNMLNVLVQPEFFEIPKGLAISKSIYLIDVTYDINESGHFERGKFKFYSRRSKKLLYLYGKKTLDYNAWRPDFSGDFPHFYPVDEAEYRHEKAESLKRWHKFSAQDQRWREWTSTALKLYYKTGKTYREIADEFNEISKVKISFVHVGRLLKGEKYDEVEE